MSALNQSHYHCLIDPSDNSIISQGETELDECSPMEFGNRLIERWGKSQLSSMRDRETRTLDYFYAADLIRPHRAVAEFTKGPFVAVRSVTGSPYPGHEEHLPYQYGYDHCRPARYDEFPLPENPPDYLARGNFYEPDAIKQALSDCIEELKTAVSSDFSPDAIAKLLSRTESLVVSTGGQGLLLHPLRFHGPNEEDNAILILDAVIFAVLEKSPDSLRSDAIQAYQERRKNSDLSEHEIRECLSWIRSETE